MNKMILLIPLTFAVFLSSSNLQAQEGYMADNNLRFVPNSNGFVSIYNPLGEEISKFGFGVTGNIGSTDYIYTSTDFSWNKEYSNGVLTVNNNNVDFPWEVQFDLLENQPKITHEISNNLGTTITNGKFWYIMTVPEDTSIRYAKKQYTPSFSKPNVHLKNLDNITIHNIHFGSYYINFDDLLVNNFNLTDAFIGNGSIIGYPEQLIIALGATKNDGVFPSGATVLLDPQIFNSSNTFPTANGTLYNDWISSGNLFADDGALSLVNNEGDTVTVSNFSFLESDGGQEVPDDISAVVSVDILMEVGNTCISDGGDCTFTADMTWDGGTTWTPINFSKTSGCEIKTEYFGGLLSDGAFDDWSKLDWKASDFANGSFAVRMNLSKKFVEPLSAINCRVDYISAGLKWNDADENNITHHADNPTDSTSTKIYHLALSNVTSPINKSNVAIYSPFDWDNNLVNIINRDVINYNIKGLDGLKKVQAPVAVEDGGVYGSALNFSVTAVGRRRAMAYAGFNTDRAETWFDLHNFTMSVWLKREEQTAGYNGTLIDFNSNEDYRFWIKGPLGAPTTYRPRITIKNSAGTEFGLECTTNSNNLAWTHFTATFNSTSLAIYRNGANCGNTAITGTIARSGTEIITVGAVEAGFNDKHYYLGMMDDLLMLNIALNSTQVNDLYTGAINFTYQTGYLEFTNRTTTNVTVNLSTSLLNIHTGTDINLTVGNKTGDTYGYTNKIYYNKGTSNDTPIGTPSNYSYQFWFYGHDNGHVSPYMNATVVSPNPFIETFFETDDCRYTGGNYEPGCANNCVQAGSNINLCDGCNVTFSGAGSYLLHNGFNITNWDNNMVTGGCWYQQREGSCFI